MTNKNHRLLNQRSEYMEIYLLNNRGWMTVSWNRAFQGVADVSVECTDLEYFLYKHKVECIVSPANSYGHNRTLRRTSRRCGSEIYH